MVDFIYDLERKSWIIVKGVRALVDNCNEVMLESALLRADREDGGDVMLHSLRENRDLLPLGPSVGRLRFDIGKYCDLRYDQEQSLRASFGQAE